MTRPETTLSRVRSAAPWLVLAAATGAGLAGCIFLDWSAPNGSTGADAGCAGCDDQNDCTDDTCDPATHGCTHTPRASGTPCTSKGGTRCDGNGACVGGRVLWARTFKGSLPSSSLAHLSVDPSGDVALVGSLTGAFDFGGGSQIASDAGTAALGIASFAGDGGYRWSHVYGANGATVTGQGGASDPQGNVVVAASISGSGVDFGLGKVSGAGSSTGVVVAKYASEGSPFFAHGFDAVDGGAGPSGVSTDPQSNVYAIGSFTGALDLGGGKLGGGNRFLASFDAAGKIRWSKGFNENTFVSPTLALDPKAGVLVTGSYIGALDLGNPTYDLSSKPPALFVARFGLADGAVVWSTSFGSTTGSTGVLQPTAIAVDPAGNILLAGVLASPIVFGSTTLSAPGCFVAKLDPGGVPLWSRALGSDTYTTGSVLVTSAGTDTVVAGTFTNAIDLGDGFITTKGKQDLYVAKYDATGDLLWKQTFGDTADQLLTGLAVDADGSVFVSGGDQGAVDFGGAILPDAGTPGGLFLLKLAP